MWLKGRPRQELAAEAFWRNLVAAHGLRGAAKMAAVSPRTVWRWMHGARTSRASFERVADAIAPQSEGALPLYAERMALDGDTRVGGVGDYTRHSARGGLCVRTF